MAKKQQIHEATFRVTRQIPLRPNKHGGIEVELIANKKRLGTLTITGAQISFNPATRARETTWDFTTFVDILKQYS